MYYIVKFIVHGKRRFSSSVLHSCNVKTQICVTRPQCVNDVDTFSEIRRCANVIECTYTNLDSTVKPTTHLVYMV